MKRINFFFLFILAFFLILSFLSSPQIFNWDEGMWASISKEMANSNDFLTLSFLGQPYFLKPPLYFWLTAFSIKIFGSCEFSVRFFSAVFGLLTVPLVFLIGKRFYSTQIGLISGHILLSSVMFIASAKVGLLDTALVFFSYLAIFGLFSYIQKKNEWGAYLAYFSLGLAFLAKGPLAIVLILAALFFQSIFEKSTKIFTQLWHLKAALIGSLIPLIWFLGNLMRYGYRFFEQFIIYNHFHRFLYTVMNDEPIYYYLIIFAIGFMPFSFFCFDLFRGFSKKNILIDRFSTFLIFYIAFCFILFSLGRDNAAGYILPVFPAYAILLGRYFNALFETQAQKNTGFVFMFFLGIIFILIAMNIKTLNSKEYFSSLQILLFILGISYILSFLFYLFKRIRASFGTIIIAQAFLVFYLCALILPIYEKFNHPPIKQISRYINETGEKNIFSFRMRYYPSIHFYTKNKIKEVEDKNKLADMTRQLKKFLIVTERGQEIPASYNKYKFSCYNYDVYLKR